MPAKDSLPKNGGTILNSSGLSGKTITGVGVYQHGSVIVIEVAYSGGSSFVKVKGLQLESGGTNEWGTGTIVL